MKAGRKPTPRGLKILRGNPGKRPISDEVNLPAGVPAAPRELHGAARTEWDRITALLGPAKVLTEAEQQVLAGYCLAVARAWKAERRAAKDASQEARAEKAWDHVRHYAGLFGIGPAERGRVKAASDAQDGKKSLLA
jgi:phage terminase small subunit